MTTTLWGIKKLHPAYWYNKFANLRHTMKVDGQ